MNPTNGKRQPPLNRRTDSNLTFKTGIVTCNVCSVYVVQNTKKHSFQLPDEQKSNAVERVVHVKIERRKAFAFGLQQNTEHENDGNFSDKHDKHFEKLHQINNFP